MGRIALMDLERRLGVAQLDVGAPPFFGRPVVQVGAQHMATFTLQGPVVTPLLERAGASAGCTPCWQESLSIFGFLQRHAPQGKSCTCIVWEQGTLALWDSRSAFHCPLNDDLGERREMHRVVRTGEGPRGRECH
jgi:hypothetical protein